MDEMFLWWIISIICVIGAQLTILVVAWLLLRKGGLWSLLRFRMGGHMMDILVRRTRGIAFKVKKIPTKTINFKVTDELGREKKIPVVVEEPQHHLEGGSQVINVAVEGVQCCVNLTEKYKANKSSEYWNQLLESVYLEAYRTGLSLRDDQKKDLFEKLTPMFTIILICCSLATVAMCYMILTNMAPPGTVA